MVILKAPPQFLDHYEGREPGQQPIKWNLLSVFLERSEAEQTVCYFGCLAQIDGGRNSAMYVSQSYLRRQTILKKIFPLPLIQIWSISTYNQSTFEIPDKIHLSPCIMLRFILHEIISNRACRCLWCFKHLKRGKGKFNSLCKEEFIGNRLTGFKKRRLGPNF